MGLWLLEVYACLLLSVLADSKDHSSHHQLIVHTAQPTLLGLPTPREAQVRGPFELSASHWSTWPLHCIPRPSPF